MRYFIIWYINETTEEKVNGMFDYKSKEYPNRSEIKQKILRLDPKTTAPYITNIIELNETDYNNWIK